MTKTYVLLQAPNDGYYIVKEATSEKHWELLDKGWQEMYSGTWDEMIETMQALEEYDDKKQN